MSSHPPGCSTEAARHDHLPLGLGIEIDQHVPQEHEVEQPEVRQRLVQVHLQELHSRRAAPSRRAACLPARPRPSGRSAADSHCEHIPGALHRVVPGPRPLKHTHADVEGHHFPRMPRRDRSSSSIAMLYASSPVEPAALQMRSGCEVGTELHLLAQKLEVLRLAEKIGLVGRQQIDRDLHFLRGLAAREQAKIIRITRGVRLLEPPRAGGRSPAPSSPATEADAGRLVDEPLELRELLVRDRVHQPVELPRRSSDRLAPQPR